jgi:hypothetical protein
MGIFEGQLLGVFFDGRARAQPFAKPASELASPDEPEPQYLRRSFEHSEQHERQHTKSHEKSQEDRQLFDYGRYRSHALNPRMSSSIYLWPHSWSRGYNEPGRAAMATRGRYFETQLQPAPRLTLHVRFNHTRSTVLDLYLNLRLISHVVHTSAALGSGLRKGGWQSLRRGRSGLSLARGGGERGK